MKRSFLLSCAAFLSALAASGLSACENGGAVGGYERYDNAAFYAAGNVDIDGATCTKIEIDWIGGSIEVEESADGLRVIEDGTDSRMGNADEKMHYYLDGSVLKVKYCEAGHRGKIDETGKNLRVELPKGVSIEIDCVNANTVVGVIEVPEFLFESDTGNLDAERIRCSRAEIETNSGEIYIGDISADELSAESERGNMQLGFSACIRAELENARGDITLNLHGGVGVRLEYETARGELVTEKTYTQSGKIYEFAPTSTDGGRRLCTIEAETGSGKLYVK